MRERPAAGTRVFAILGDPIAQVRSPAVFNTLFSTHGVDAVMVPLGVGAADLPAVLSALRCIGTIDGLVITVPHKPAAAALLRRASRRVALAGACNVLRPVEGGWEGDLFDGEGFAIGLERRGIDLAGRRCALVGAGGAGAAIALALVERGVAALSICDAEPGRAERLVERLERNPTGAKRGSIRLRSTSDDLESGSDPIRSDGAPEDRGVALTVGGPDADTDIAINATPLGMQADDPLPFDVKVLRPGTLVADAIMKPPVTRLLEAAQRHGCRTQEGRHMLDCQVAAIWDFFSLPALPAGV